jgi:hypothetical protein
MVAMMGASGINVLTRMSAFILLCIGIQIVRGGISALRLAIAPFIIADSSKRANPGDRGQPAQVAETDRIRQSFDKRGHPA